MSSFPHVFPRRLLPQETWLSYRKIIQAWDESICKVAAKDLPKADYDMLAEAVLTGNHMDAEILCMLNRRPRVFHLRMLPTCAVEVGSDEVAADIAKAHVEAAAAKLKLFEAELRSDWAALREAETAKQQLKELLHWLDLEHRRTQAALGEALVAKRMAKTHPVVQVEGWDKLASQLGLLVRSWDADSPDCPRRAILWLDFNTPHARDSLRMPALAAAMGNAARVLGPENTIIFVWMPSYSKEDSVKGPDDDEVEIVSLLKRAGFCVQRRIRMLLAVHPSVANKTTELDWWADGRMGVLAKEEKGLSNWWFGNSELARTRRVADSPMLPQTKDLVALTSMNADEDVNQDARAPDVAAKCAQRGPGVAEVQLAALLAKTPLGPKDETVIIDLMPYVGDRAIGVYNYAKSPAAENQGRFRHVIVKMTGSPKDERAALFTVRRLANIITKEWLRRSIVLHDTVRDMRGETEVAVYPSDVVPPPTDEQLRSIKGGAAAWRGLAALEFKTCFVRGSKVKIQPARLADFEGAPLEVHDQLDALTASHERDYEDLLVELEGQEQAALQDSRQAPADEPPAGDPTGGTELVTYGSEEELKGTATITHSARSADRAVTILKDDKENYFLMTTKDKHVLKEGTHVGGVGGGAVVAEDGELKRCWPWWLPKADKTWVELNRPPVEGDDSAKAALKYTAGTLYSVVRELEASATSPPKLTSFGALMPSGSPGRHEYKFEFPRDHESHEKLAFVPSPGAHPPTNTHTHTNARQTHTLAQTRRHACPHAHAHTHTHIA